jgi:hypothetical protein
VISVDVAQIAAGREAIAHALLQGFDVGKAAVAPAFPDYVPVELDLKRAAGGGAKRHFADLFAEGREELLRHPGGPQKPMALRAIGDGNARFGLHVRPHVDGASARVEQ